MWQSLPPNNPSTTRCCWAKRASPSQYGGIDYLPTTFYIDRNGVVLDRVFGQPDSRDEIEQNVKRVIASTAEPRS